MYRLDEPGEFKNLVDLQYASVISHPTGGKNDIPNRLRRHCSTFDVPLPTDTSLRQIFGVTFSSRFGQTVKRGDPAVRAGGAAAGGEADEHHDSMLAMEHRGSSEKATCAVWLTLIPVACGIMSTARTRWTTRSLGQIFTGLAMSGSWGCFDELSRIPVDVLLVVTVLSAEGFLEARDLAKKFVTLYRLDSCCPRSVATNGGCGPSGRCW